MKDGMVVSYEPNFYYATLYDKGDCFSLEVKISPIAIPEIDAVREGQEFLEKTCHKESHRKTVKDPHFDFGEYDHIYYDVFKGCPGDNEHDCRTARTIQE